MANTTTSTEPARWHQAHTSGTSGTSGEPQGNFSRYDCISKTLLPRTTSDPQAPCTHHKSFFPEEDNEEEEETRMIHDDGGSGLEAARVLQ
eukprot:CAMPEP_0194756496 /NCGR_PEP_ID=MMETSP0323_2-20130528/10188_1 /TAXON_ID=2866 ORGANISM="Crypthecodinium cohnii, Strain Seligo" /NCGR_SAMPLE_ID=MMETSP0323_2 /ASSEMBLY_ACC=CAM_ASM_000346 /LENGTH=90 /DNA_ID=CAMNT_0039676035 /DNA_START=146 /DNA_END=418 /DNA_ORIENTATION=-